MDKMQTEEIEPDHTWKKPLKAIVALILLILVILMIVPDYVIKIDPEPYRLPEVSEVMQGDPEILTYVIQVNKTEDFTLLVRPSMPQVKYTANRIATKSCFGGRICHAKAIYYFIRDRLQYVSDPLRTEFVESPLLMIGSGGGDCESGSIALAALMEAVGIDAQLVIVHGHAYARIMLEEAPAKYKYNGWIYLDWTCKDCGFGEIPWENWEKEHVFIEVP